MSAQGDKDEVRENPTDSDQTKRASKSLSQRLSEHIILVCTIVGTGVAVLTLVIAYISIPSPQPALDLQNMMDFNEGYRLFVFNRGETARDVDVRLRVNGSDGQLDEHRQLPVIGRSDTATIIDFPSRYLAGVNDGDVQICITAASGWQRSYWLFENRGSGLGGSGYSLRLVDQGTRLFGAGNC
jgi:hypothetical protein